MRRVFFPKTTPCFLAWSGAQELPTLVTCRASSRARWTSRPIWSRKLRMYAAGGQHLPGGLLLPNGRSPCPSQPPSKISLKSVRVKVKPPSLSERAMQRRLSTRYSPANTIAPSRNLCCNGRSVRIAGGLLLCVLWKDWVWWAGKWGIVSTIPVNQPLWTGLTLAWLDPPHEHFTLESDLLLFNYLSSLFSQKDSACVRHLVSESSVFAELSFPCWIVILSKRGLGWCGDLSSLRSFPRIGFECIDALKPR